MDILVEDSVNRAAGRFILRVDQVGVVSQISTDGTQKLGTWTKAVDPARLEHQSDGRSIRVGFKRFVIVDGESNESIEKWLSAYSDGEAAPLVAADDDGNKVDKLAALRAEGLLTDDELAKLQEERDKNNRLAALRAQGLLSEAELKLLGAAEPAVAAPKVNPPRPPRYVPPAPQPNYAGPTNAFAIASFVLSLIGGSLLAVIFGHIALSQINRTRESGRGLALAGLIIGYITLGIIVIFILSVMTAASSVDY